MTEWKRIMLLAKRDLIVLGVSILVGVSVVLGINALAERSARSVVSQQALLQEQQNQLATKQEDLTNVRTHIQSYERLKMQGLVGDPDRALWVEQLQSVVMGLGLPGQMVVQLQAAKPLAQDATQDTQETPMGPLLHELQFEIRDSMETDVLHLIDTYRGQVKGRFRLNSCKWFEPKDTGFAAQCVLHFVSIPLAPSVVAAP